MNFENITIGQIIRVLTVIGALVVGIQQVIKYFKKAVELASKDIIEETSTKLLESWNAETANLSEELKALADKLDTLVENDTIQQEALMNIAADRIQQAYNYYNKPEHCEGIDPHSFEVLESLYEAYTKLHGNGLVKKQMEYIKSLHIYTYKEMEAQKVDCK